MYHYVVWKLLLLMLRINVSRPATRYLEKWSGMLALDN